MTKRAIYIVRGIKDMERLKSVILSLSGTTREVLIDSPHGRIWGEARVSCWEAGKSIMLEVSFRYLDGEVRRWVWHDLFEINLVYSDPGSILDIKRVSGFGRISAEVVFNWILERASEHNIYLEIITFTFL